ncbi:MAG: PA14 domain-containing protein, partial [Planctomycetes bacterium]|nr:PA14 domain-containing protein [Planctomycetota bacterium]
MRPALLILLVCAASAAERQLAWDALPQDGKPLVLAEDARLVTDRPATLAIPVTFAEAGPDGIETTVVARCLRAVREDDWRTSQAVAGRRRQERIDHAATAFGTPAERKAWGIAGSDRDWENFSVQWDGRIAVPVDGVELATASDDGSRLWIDRDGDGRCSAGEWGDNGWGDGQGTTQRVVAANLPAGIWRFRLQYEEGGGGNACILRWRLPGKPWEAVPASAFAPRPSLRLSGAITCSARFSGRGRVILGDGVILAGSPLPVETVVAGKVQLAADVDLGPAVFASGRLACAGRSLRLGATSGSGTIDLEGGQLVLAPGSHALALVGPGRVEIDGQATVASLDDAVEVVRGGVRSSQR